jgi:cbb3-type cytochrome oxidase maturation protein
MLCVFLKACLTFLCHPKRRLRLLENWENVQMDILYLLIPLSVVLVFFILAGLWWAIDKGQFEDIEAEGERILRED